MFPSFPVPSDADKNSANKQNQLRPTNKTEDIIMSVGKKDTSNTLNVMMDINGVSCNTLLDTGAKVNVISESVARQFMSNAQFKQSSKKLQAANNSPVEVLGAITLQVSINDGVVVKEYESTNSSQFSVDGQSAIDRSYGLNETVEEQVAAIESATQSQRIVCRTRPGKDGHTFSAEFIVAKRLAVPILIGWPTLQDMGAVIDAQEKSVRFRWITEGHGVETKIFYKPKKADTQRIILRQKCSIEPQSSCWIPIDQPVKMAHGEYGELKSMSTVPGLLVGGLIDGETRYIGIYNPTDHHYTLKAGAVVALVKKRVAAVNVVEENVQQPAKNEFEEELNAAISKGRLTQGEQRKLKSLIDKYRDRFRKKVMADDSKFNEKPHHIQLMPEARPVICAMSRLNPEKQKIVEDTVKDLLERKLIEEGDGSWRSRIVLVRKKDGGWRTTIDYRKVNEVIQPNGYPMPRCDEILDQLHGARYFSKLDMTDGFWQIKLDEVSKDVTGFATRSQFYRWRVLPMGLKTSPGVFQSSMDRILGELKWRCVMCYVDDLIIFSKTFEEHLKHISEVLTRLENAGMYIKMSKCAFGVESIEFLGHIVTREGIQADPKKTKALSDMPPPSDAHGVRRFLGLAGFYRRYVKDFAARTVNLRALTEKGAEFKWTKEHADEFEDIKKALTSNPVMAYPDFERNFILATDASIKGLGAVLSQQYPQGERVISYASRSLNKHEQKYGISQLECLAVVWATEHHKVYLQDHKFDLVTDHRALTKLSAIKDSNPMLERWAIKLSRYPFEAKYRPGEEHLNADCLSREPVDLIAFIEEWKAVEEPEPVCGIEIDEFVEWQKADKDLIHHYNAVLKKGRDTIIINSEGGVVTERERMINGHEAFVIRSDGRLWFRAFRDKGRTKGTWDRLCIPSKLVPEVISIAHEPNHFAFRKTMDKVKEKCWWENMNKDVCDYVKSCTICAQRNTPQGFNSHGQIQAMEVSAKFETIGVDLFSPGPKSTEGHEYVLACTDYATKWVTLIAVRNKEAKTIADAIWEQWVCTFGCPRNLISDNGLEFIGKDIAVELYNLMSIKKHTTTPYHPRANGQVERFNKTMANMLAKRLTNDTQRLWHKHLATIALEYNCTRHAATGETPFYLVFGQEPHMPLDELLKLDVSKKFEIETWKKEGIPLMRERMRMSIQSIKAAQDSNRKRRNEKLKEIKFNIGDKVLIREEPRTEAEKLVHRKLRLPWIGPFTIHLWEHSENKNVYQVSRRKANGQLDIRTVNVKNIKKIYERPKWLQQTGWEQSEDVPVEEMELDDARDGEFIPNEEEMQVEEPKAAQPLPQASVEPMQVQKSTSKVSQPTKRVVIQDVPQVIPTTAPSPTVNVQGPAKTASGRPSRAGRWIPSVGAQVDVRFITADLKAGKPWSCGTVTAVRGTNEVYIKFLDGADEDWYTLGDQPGDINRNDIRQCTPANGHVRSELTSCGVLLIEKPSKGKLKKRWTANQKRGAKHGQRESLTPSESTQYRETDAVHH